MQSTGRPLQLRVQMLGGATFLLTWLFLLVLLCLVTPGYGMTDETIANLR
jgi:hypothetical protein